MNDTPNLNLPYILAAQAQKHVTHNEALRALDAIVQLAVLDRDLATPPGSPADGARYLVAASPTGAWTGQAGKIAAWQDGAWIFYTPKEGWLVWVADEDILLGYNGAAFVGPVLQNVALLGVNTTADATNRLAVASAASLFNNAGGGHQVKVNKAAAGDTASFLFQTGFSGRAEIGTAGDNDFHVKVSADGVTWREALVIDDATGEVTVSQGKMTIPLNNIAGVRQKNAAGSAHLDLPYIDNDDKLRVDQPMKVNGTIEAANGQEVIARSGTSYTIALKAQCPNASAARFLTECGMGAALRQAEFSVDSAGNLVFRQTTAGGAMYFDFNGSAYWRDQNAGAATRIAMDASKVSFNLPAKVASYTLAGAPSAAAAGEGAIIYVSNEAGGAVLAFSDGANWRRVTDRAVVS
jgi:Protein of unknown function (DUF2793)